MSPAILTPSPSSSSLLSSSTRSLHDIRVQKKTLFLEKVQHLFFDTRMQQVLLVSVDNVSSTQMHQVRASLRNKHEAILLMGKNTLIKKALDLMSVMDGDAFVSLKAHLNGNIGLVFCYAPSNENDFLAGVRCVRDTLVSNRVQSAPRIGLFAQKDIVVQAGNTGIDPQKTAFFQALSIPTKVVRGSIEITRDVLLVKEGTRVGASESALMNMLGMKPFNFGMRVVKIYDRGVVYEPDILDMTTARAQECMTSAAQRVGALALELAMPVEMNTGHYLSKAIMSMLAISKETKQISLGSPLDEILLQTVEITTPAAKTRALKNTVEEEHQKLEAETEDEIDLGSLF